MKSEIDLFVKKIVFNKDEEINFDEYPFNIDILKKMDELRLSSPVTFLIGENGVGKSTFIEAFAISLGLNPEGGTQNFNFSTRDTHSNLYKYFKISRFGIPKTTFFLRAESFYNVASEVDNLFIPGYGKVSLHERSHGESFLQLIENRFSENGLYILDEPESALSPSNQLTLLCFIDKLVKSGSQFIIATHSPILISYVNGEILDLNNNFEKIKYEDTDIYKMYKLYLDNAEDMQRRLFE